MKLSEAQKNDLETVKFFLPQGMKNIPISDRDIEMFFENSERGMHKDLLNSTEGIEKCPNGFYALIQGKIWRGRHMEMYEEGIMSGDMPYAVILGAIEGYEKPPRSVVDFMKKEMFKGIDKDMIESIYTNYQ